MTSITVPLCLACSQSLSEKSLDLYFCTPCCGRLICDRCLSKNARLRRYNPCLSCLGGVGLVQNTSGDRGDRNKEAIQHGRDNEAETFVLGDSDDEDIRASNPIQSEAVRPRSPPLVASESQELEHSNPSNRALPQSSTYYIKPRDTVTGIALKYGVDVSKLMHESIPTFNSPLYHHSHVNFVGSTNSQQAPSPQPLTFFTPAPYYSFLRARENRLRRRQIFRNDLKHELKSAPAELSRQ
jgi:hypothetical protein